MAAISKGKSKFIPILCLVIDTVLLLVSFYICELYLFHDKIDRLLYAIILSCMAFLWGIICFKFKLYSIPRVIFIDKIVSKNLYGILVFMFISGGLIYFTTDYKFSRSFFLVTIFNFACFVLINRILLIFFIKKYRQRGYNYRKIIIVGYNPIVSNLIEKVFLFPSYGYQISGLFAEKKEQLNGYKEYYLGEFSDVISYLKNNRVDEIIISLPSEERDRLNEILYYSDNNMIRASIIPEFSEYLSPAFTIDYLENIPVLKIRKEPLQSLSNRMLKRSFDVVVSSLFVVLLYSWLFPIIALVIKLTSKGPVFFTQKRTGKNGVPFDCYKFRSMRVNKDSDKLQASKNDDRVTPFGRFLRRTSIDEFPQLFNVLQNHMSLVGPRPHMLKHTEEYRQQVDRFMVRHFAKPGVTGWAQICGFRGETKTVKDMENRANADIWYIENWSFLLDLKIVLKTIWNMFFTKEENAY